MAVTWSECSSTLKKQYYAQKALGLSQRIGKPVELTQSPLKTDHVLGQGGCWKLNCIDWLGRNRVPHVVVFAEATGDTGFALCSLALQGEAKPGVVRKAMAEWMWQNQALAAEICQQCPSYRRGNWKLVAHGTCTNDWFRRDVHGRIFAYLSGRDCLFFHSVPKATDQPPMVFSTLDKLQGRHHSVVAFYNCNGRLGLVYPALEAERPGRIHTSWRRKRFQAACQMVAYARDNPAPGGPSDHPFLNLKDFYNL